MEETLSIIKPDGVNKKLIGTILKKFEDNGFEIINIKRLTLTNEQAGEFYSIHKERPFFKELVSFMTSGPCVPFVIKGENAILRVREIMGATDPSEAAEGTIRADYADSIDKNIIHGSDSKESAEIEIPFFFG
ncbi:nucleoside-diphosphate kinase [bacterium]|jgi:nucleoside-diphosphate kinase|nr:nucleoside-diphosphate kinase [bacterium]MBT3795219.1 nucleoside-diphosphate kinase [bacterium]MBT4634464.1 nucleoside-diphosphate kinase [bacterium]